MYKDDNFFSFEATDTKKKIMISKKKPQLNIYTVE